MVQTSNKVYRNCNQTVSIVRLQ